MIVQESKMRTATPFTEIIGDLHVVSREETFGRDRYTDGAVGKHLVALPPGQGRTESSHGLLDERKYLEHGCEPPLGRINQGALAQRSGPLFGLSIENGLLRDDIRATRKQQHTLTADFRLIQAGNEEWHPISTKPVTERGCRGVHDASYILPQEDEGGVLINGASSQAFGALRKAPPPPSVRDYIYEIEREAEVDYKYADKERDLRLQDYAFSDTRAERPVETRPFSHTPRPSYEGVPSLLAGADAWLEPPHIPLTSGYVYPK